MKTVTNSEPAQDKLQQKSNPRVLRLKHGIVNSYLVGDPGAGDWALVDAGLAPRSATTILQAAQRRFGSNTRPASIILTHGHFDHVGALEQLVRIWNVPVYSHELELPYLTGRSSYPPPDPTVGGGLMARMAGLYPRRPINLGTAVHPLPDDGLVPGLPGWRWVHTPGHSPGHISLFRFSDRLLLVGDAFVTVKQESLLAVLAQRQEIHGPPAYYTPDWNAALSSLETLLHLDPDVAATGHGVPMGGDTLRRQLEDLVRNFQRRAVPRRGRYVRTPAITDATGLVSVPPRVPDPFPIVLGAGLAALAALALMVQGRKKQIPPPRRARQTNGSPRLARRKP
jgi:glyoxylase-like metal-dependent hydrolase (beta-lactamase superfamily II)